MTALPSSQPVPAVVVTPALLSLMLLPCPAQAVYGPAFGVMIGIAVATLVCSIANSLYFVSNPLRPRRLFSPFPLEPLYKTYDEREAYVL